MRQKSIIILLGEMTNIVGFLTTVLRIVVGGVKGGQGGKGKEAYGFIFFTHCHQSLRRSNT